MSLSGRTNATREKLKITAEERILITVVSTVVVAVTQAFRIDADVGVVTLDLACWTRPVGCNGKRSKHRPPDQKHMTSTGPARLGMSLLFMKVDMTTLIHSIIIIIAITLRSIKQLQKKSKWPCHEKESIHYSRQLISSEVALSLQSLWPSQTKAALMQRPLPQVNSVVGLHVGKGQPCSSLLSPQSSV